jgi:hypothetical protein
MKCLETLKEASSQWNTGADEVNLISYLPATFTTLFVLAASLLLDLIRAKARGCVGI